jgi:hypothetical protein
MVGEKTEKELKNVRPMFFPNFEGKRGRIEQNLKGGNVKQFV